ncbi:MAG: hypothetical protein BMS9Abin26_1468 [Gammaproteobacteria bacterium]|nr:MAG: hypothetical protein BMS9Abin26_1468 [Gammaproteobacteria bacterium]
MAYAIIQPPFTLQFRNMSKDDILEYGKWFHQVVPDRIKELTKYVNSTPDYESWTPDLSPGSLGILGNWFEGQVEDRDKTIEEIEETRSKLIFPVDIPDKELTNESFSLSMDIGMYFGQVILNNIAGAKWEQELKNQKLADYGQPVIFGSGVVALNPVRVIIMTAYGILNKKPAKLKDLYDIWEQMLNPV